MPPAVMCHLAINICQSWFLHLPQYQAITLALKTEIITLSIAMISAN